VIVLFDVWTYIQTDVLLTDQVHRRYHVYSSLLRALGQINFTKKSGFIIKASGKKTTAFGKIFRRRTGKMSS